MTKPLVMVLNSKYFQESMAADLSPRAASGADLSQCLIRTRNPRLRYIVSAHASNNALISALRPNRLQDHSR